MRHRIFHFIKKRPKPSDDDSKESIDLNTVMVAAIARGLTYDAIQEMEIGQIVDFCIEYNKMNGAEEEKPKPKKRKATQADWDAFFG